jgi:hypothetical protein
VILKKIESKPILKKLDSDAYKLLSKKTVDTKKVTDQDFFEYENRLRHIIYDILKPTHLKLKETQQAVYTQKIDTERYKKNLVENMDWVRELGDANQVEDKLNTKISKIENHFEISHNMQQNVIKELLVEFKFMK